MPKDLKRELHHYWPEGLSGYWKDSDGQTTRLRWNGEILRAPPQNFGALGDGHRIKMGGGWDSSIESLFQHADDHLPYIVEQLLSLESKHGFDQAGFEDRLLGQILDDASINKLCEGLASLIVRSPNFRNQQKITTDYYRQGLPYRDKIDEKNLIIMNMRNQYTEIVSNMRHGKIIIMFSDLSEFIFGEGFLSNISGIGTMGGTECLVPLTPTLAVAYHRPVAYRTMPKILTIRLNSNEVRSCNNISQVYTKEYIYYRTQEPIIYDSFPINQFLQFEYHNHPWLDALLEVSSNFRSKE